MVPAAAQDPSGSYAGEIDCVMGPTPEDAIRQLQPLIDLGVTLVTVYFTTGGPSTCSPGRSSRRFADRSATEARSEIGARVVTGGHW